MASRQLDWSGFVSRPSWEALKLGAGPPTAWFTEPGEWQHGWQHHASSCSQYHVRETVMAQSCREPGSFAGAFGSVSKFGVVRIAHTTGVRSETAPLPHHRAGTVAPLTDDHRGEVRMPRCSRRQRSRQGGMSPIWETPFTGCAHGAHPCPSVSRGGRHSEVQHQTVGHEPQRPRHRRTGDQGSGVEAADEPLCRALQIQPDLFRKLTMERMRLPTHIGTDSASGNGLRDVTQEAEACRQLRSITNDPLWTLVR